MRPAHCTRCEIRLGPRNAKLGSEMCHQCQMEQVGIPRVDYRTKPQTTAPQEYQQLTYELWSTTALPGYIELICELRSAPHWH